MIPEKLILQFYAICRLIEAWMIPQERSCIIKAGCELASISYCVRSFLRLGFAYALHIYYTVPYFTLPMECIMTVNWFQLSKDGLLGQVLSITVDPMLE